MARQYTGEQCDRTQCGVAVISSYFTLRAASNLKDLTHLERNSLLSETQALSCGYFFLFIVVNFFFVLLPPGDLVCNSVRKNQQLTQMIKTDPGAEFLYIPSHCNRIFLVPNISVRLLVKPG